MTTYNVRGERSAGWSGLAFIAILVAAAFLAGIPPQTAASAGAVNAYLRQAPGRDEGLPALTAASTLVGGIFIYIGLAPFALACA